MPTHVVTGSRWKAGVASFLFLVICAVVMPSPSAAIPLAGDYIFTSGFSGTFTSDGSVLTAWNFTDPISSINWQNGAANQTVVPRPEDAFLTGIYEPDINAPVRATEVYINWTRGDWSVSLPGPDVYSGLLTWAPAASVPEPLSFLHLGFGLLAFVWYVARQRRQAGLQVG